MCGIVGLHLRSPQLYPHLGQLLSQMLVEMQDRGADSAGVAIYGDPALSPAGQVTVSLLDVDGDPLELGRLVSARCGSEVGVSAVADVLLLSAAVPVEALVAAVRQVAPRALMVGYGADLAVLKGVGTPRDLVVSWQLEQAHGRQAVGHTRMATESAVTPAGSHPYAVGDDQCLVHNGSFSNHATIRRELRSAGVRFDSENDTEVGARFIADQLERGLTIETALKELCRTFDGFYTLLVSNYDSFAVVRDAIACKPAVIAETPQWVAMASEYRAFVGLPGVEQARIWEPEPEVVYVWTR